MGGNQRERLQTWLYHVSNNIMYVLILCIPASVVTLWVNNTKIKQKTDSTLIELSWFLINKE